MTNPLIPYSFIPGTKAKANEVNANFISIADAVESTRQYTIDEIASLDTKIQTNLEEIQTSIPSKDLKDTNYFTNCIIDAPNGVAEYSGKTITVKEGLKVLIPDGRNEDGSIKSIEYTLEADAVLTLDDETLKTYLTISSNGEISYTALTKTSFIVSETAPSYQSKIYWYQPSTNLFKYTNDTGANWTKKNITIIGEFNSSKGTISSLSPNYKVEFMKNTDKHKILDWLSPDYTSIINKSANVAQQAECNAVLIVYGGANAANVEICNLYIGYNKNSLKQITVSRIGAGANDRQTITVPIPKGIWYNVTGNGVLAVQFIPLKGETHA